MKNFKNFFLLAISLSLSSCAIIEPSNQMPSIAPSVSIGPSYIPPSPTPSPSPIPTPSLPSVSVEGDVGNSDNTTYNVTNGVATYKERVLPSEWGDPGEDGFYGNDNTLPSGADEDAYYWIDIVVSNATAKVLFAGDKPSNYPDPEFIAKYNETNRVFLLIGKKYTATSDETITVVSKSSDDIIIDSISDNEIDIVLPVEFLVTNENEIDKTAARAVTQVPLAGGFKIMPFPFLKGYYVWNSNEACCITHSNKVNDVWLFSCNKECNCMGCSFNGTFHYEGYYLDVLDVSCGCSFVEKPSATASISFSKSAVIFENCYTNAPNDIVPRRSTTNSLDITIYGGPFGGNAEIDFDDKGKLEYLTQEAIPHSISVAAEETVNLSFPFTAKEESASEKDIKVRLKFTENFTGDVIESEDEMTAVRVCLTPQVVIHTFVNRHVWGIAERILCEWLPANINIDITPHLGVIDDNPFFVGPSFRYYISPMLFVSCESSSASKNKFPDFDPNSVGGNSVNDNSTKKPSNSNTNKNNNSNNNNNSTTKPNTSGKKRVAITYDDGPHNVQTINITDELAKYGFHATFFVVGNRIDGKAYNGAKGLKYAASKGNEIAIHAYTHNKYYDTCSNSDYKAEIENTYDAIKDVVPNAKVKLMRPVGGRITAERMQNCDYAVIMWSVDSNDWKYKNEGSANVDTIVNNVMSQVQDGSIILMHDIYENTYLASKEILKQLNEQGYEVVTVSELLGNPRAGVKYSKAS